MVVGEEIAAGVLVSEAHGLAPLQQFELSHGIGHCPVFPLVAYELKIDGQH
jgi:hypothetical protein